MLIEIVLIAAGAEIVLVSIAGVVGLVGLGSFVIGLILHPTPDRRFRSGWRDQTKTGYIWNSNGPLARKMMWAGLRIVVLALVIALPAVAFMEELETGLSELAKPLPTAQTTNPEQSSSLVPTSTSPQATSPESTIAQSNSLNPTPTPAPTLTPLPTNVFMAANSMSHARTAHAAVTLQDGRVLVAGGVNGFGSMEESLNSAEIFDPQTEEWAAAANLNISRDDFTMTLLKDGRVLAAGGQGTNSLASGTSAEVYNPIANAWEFVGDMTMVRSHHNAILLVSGQVLIIGGNAHEITGYFDEAVSRHKSAEIFDPVTNSFSAVADLNHERNYSLATLLQDGTVLVVGGIAEEAYASAEIFDPSSGSSSLTGLMTSGRRGSDMVLLNDGTVFIRGGHGEKSSRSWASTELFDPQNGTFKEIAYSTGRSSHVSILLGNGSVLTTGGTSGSKNLDSSEIYIPSADSTGPSSVMTEPRQEHVMALIDDGRVLIIGGIGGTGVLSSVEIYYP